MDLKKATLLAFSNYKDFFIIKEQFLKIYKYEILTNY